MAAKKLPERRRRQPARRWSQRVTETSDAMTLEGHVFEKDSAIEIARSLLRSASRSKRRQSTPFRSAMSMLTFFMNRAGKNLDDKRRAVLDAAKEELRRLAGRDRPAAKKKKATTTARKKTATAKKKKKPAAKKRSTRTAKKTKKGA